MWKEEKIEEFNELGSKGKKALKDKLKKNKEKLTEIVIDKLDKMDNITTNKGRVLVTPFKINKPSTDEGGFTLFDASDYHKSLESVADAYDDTCGDIIREIVQNALDAMRRKYESEKESGREFTGKLHLNINQQCNEFKSDDNGDGIADPKDVCVFKSNKIVDKTKTNEVGDKGVGWTAATLRSNHLDVDSVNSNIGKRLQMTARDCWSDFEEKKLHKKSFHPNITDSDEESYTKILVSGGDINLSEPDIFRSVPNYKLDTSEKVVWYLRNFTGVGSVPHLFHELIDTDKPEFNVDVTLDYTDINGKKHPIISVPFKKWWPGEEMNNSNLIEYTDNLVKDLEKMSKPMRNGFYREKLLWVALQEDGRKYLGVMANREVLSKIYENYGSYVSGKGKELVKPLDADESMGYQVSCLGQTQPVTDNIPSRGGYGHSWTKYQIHMVDAPDFPFDYGRKKLKDSFGKTTVGKTIRYKVKDIGDKMFGEVVRPAFIPKESDSCSIVGMIPSSTKRNRCSFIINLNSPNHLIPTSESDVIGFTTDLFSIPDFKGKYKFIQQGCNTTYDFLVDIESDYDFLGTNPQLDLRRAGVLKPDNNCPVTFRDIYGDYKLYLGDLLTDFYNDDKSILQMDLGICAFGIENQKKPTKSVLERYEVHRLGDGKWDSEVWGKYFGANHIVYDKHTQSYCYIILLEDFKLED